MKFDLLLETCFNKLTSLKKVRIKVDPLTLLQSNDLSECPSYEGYVLEENDDMVKVLMLQPVVGIENISSDKLEEVDDSDDVLTELQRYIIDYLQLDNADPLYTQIYNCTNLDDIETFLRQSGCDEGDIMEIYRNFIAL